MQVQLGSGEYWREAYVRSAVPLLLHLLRRIILLHVLLHPKVGVCVCVCVCVSLLLNVYQTINLASLIVVKPLCNSVYGCTSHAIVFQIIALLASALTAVGNSKPDVVRQLLDLAVLLLREGNVDAVLKLVCA